jgi:large subunit ribosomal protein L1
MVLEEIKELKENSKKRNFTQTYDLVINLKEIDLKKAENKIDEIFILPKGHGKDAQITVFSDSMDKIEGCKIIKGPQIEGLANNKKELKKLIKETEFFFSEPKLMPVVGKHLGKFLAPRGLMPKPLTGDSEKIVKESKNGVKISVDKQPIIHTTIGSEDMEDKDIEKNLNEVLNFLKKRLPKGKTNIKNVYLKLTMSKPVKIEVK